MIPYGKCNHGCKGCPEVNDEGCPYCQLQEAKAELDKVVSIYEKQCVAAEKSIEEYRECVDKWKVWYDNASEDAKKWRRDAQKFFGALKKIESLNQRDNDDVPRLIAETIREALADRP